MTGDVPALRTKAAPGRLWLRLFWVSVLLTLGVMASIVPHFTDSAELVRMRNALLLQAEPAAHDWTPARVPAGFAVDPGAPTALYAEIVSRHALRVEDDDWATALKIGQHLLNDGRRNGTPIQADLEHTYRRITERGEGYCGDFADSFTGLANAAGVFSRPWAFSFDGYGGRGHIFNEIWDRKAGRWIMIDVFNNFYAVDESGQPMSAMAFRTALLAGASAPKLVAVKPTARPGFKYEDKALDYYRRGLPEWYMWWGNNVFEYDRQPLVRALAQTHRALEQLGGVAVGVHPKIRILETASNQPQRQALGWLRMRLIALVVLGFVMAACLIGWVAARRRAFVRARA